MKIALYARISKALNQNPENQYEPLINWLKQSGNTQVKDKEHKLGIFVDEISSKDTRPKKEEVLKLIRLGVADGVAFTMLDRWGRTMSELVLELEEFSKSNKSMFSLKEGLDLSTAAGRMFANILAAMANFERERIRERTLLGLARARAQGKKLGRPTKDGRKYRRPSLKEVKNYSTSGKSIREIANILNTSKYWVEVKLKELKKKGHKIEVIE